MVLLRVAQTPIRNCGSGCGCCMRHATAGCEASSYGHAEACTCMDLPVVPGLAGAVCCGVSRFCGVAILRFYWAAL